MIVYFCDCWQGRPKETEEMKPEWFFKNKLPYDNMWLDDSLWLPHVLNGKIVCASFIFSKDDQITDYVIKLK